MSHSGHPIHHHWKDNGYKSRKMVLTYFILVLMAGGYALVAFYPALREVYAEYCTALIAASTIYAGSNLTNKWVAGRVFGTPDDDLPSPDAKGASKAKEPAKKLAGPKDDPLDAGRV